jgi:NAD(P)H-dependent FMN reductase
MDFVGTSEVPRPAPVLRLRRDVKQAQGLILGTPE